jgi:glucan phosphorylase
MNAHPPVLLRSLPAELEPLAALALDLRWTWSHASDALWETLDPELWQLTHNPWVILQSVSQARLEQLAGVPQFTTDKAYPQDDEGKRLVQHFVQFASWLAVRQWVVFLAYDMALAEHLVQGVDVWLNSPRRPWEACGTSGMKVLVNGGLNYSELDAWWAEAYSPDAGWALGNGQEQSEVS